MRQSHSRGGFDDSDGIENYQGFSNQRHQNFSNSNKQIPSQAKSKIAKKSDHKNEQAREPLKTTNKQANPKQKIQEDKPHAYIIQKVDYPQKNKQENKKIPVIDSNNQSKKMESEPYTSKNLSLDSCVNTNDTINENKFIKRTKSNDEDDENLQLIASKFSKFLQERINSHQRCDLQLPSEKNQKTVSFKQPIVENISKQNISKQNSKADTHSKRPKLHQSSIQSIERPELEVQACPKKEKISPRIQRQVSDGILNRKEQSKKDNRLSTQMNGNKMSKGINVTPQRKRKSDFDTDSEDDSIDDYHCIEPKVPPKPIEHLVFEKKDSHRNSNNLKSNAKSEEEDTNDKQFKELLKRKNELDEKINNAIQFQKKQELEIESHFQSKSSHETIGKQTFDEDIQKESLIPRIEQIQNSLNSSSFSTTNSSSNQKTQVLKTSSSKNEIEYSNNSIVQLDPSNFVPQNRLFDMSGSDSDTDLKSDHNSDALSEKKSITQSPILLNKINKKKSEPRSPHVTWDISNCPPIRPKASNGFGINKSFIIPNYDEINGYSVDKEVEQTEFHDNNEMDLNSPVNFSKAMKIPKNLLSGLNSDFYNEDENENYNLLYDNYENEEEDTSGNIPNYSRILSILNKKLDESQYNEVLNIMNKYKAKHFCLLISILDHSVEALYLLRSDLQYAKIIWGEGLTKVLNEDVEKFFSINIASRRFEPMKIAEFACDVDAFTVD